MIKLIAYFCLLIPVVFGALWLAERPGWVMIEWQGYQLNMALNVLCGLVMLGFVIVLTLVLILRSLLGAPRRMKQNHQLRRYQQAIAALNETMTALALSDFSRAQKHLNKSRYYLKNDPPVTRLLGVQLAHATGDAQVAKDQFDAMLEEPQTRPVALRGKIRELMQKGEVVHARDFAEEAWRDRPSDPWLAMVLLDIYFRESDWNAIDHTIEQCRRKNAITNAQALHFRAMLNLTRAREALKQEDLQKTAELAEQALRTQPNLLPARLAKAESLARQGEHKALTRFLVSSWAVEPHPGLADLFLKYCCDESPARTHKRLERMIAALPDHLETQLLQARCYIRLAEWDKARNALKVALSKAESPRIYQLLAEVEIGETGDDKKAAVWLSQGVTAPKDFCWVCTHCGHIHTQWQHHCESCAQFDSIEWTKPESRRNVASEFLSGVAATD